MTQLRHDTPVTCEGERSRGGSWIPRSMDPSMTYARRYEFRADFRRPGADARAALHPGYACHGERPPGSARRRAVDRSIEQIIEDYSQLERADVLAALEYASAYTREREIPLTAAG